jgi:hypothetical protein
MDNRPNHIIAGFAFLLACIIIAVVIFMVARPASAPSQSASAAQVEADAEATADRMEAELNMSDAAQAPEQLNEGQAVGPPLGIAGGQDYRIVRKRLLAAGFRPVDQARQNCGPYQTTPGEECADRPEITDCSGTGKAYCMGYWIRGDESLKVVTLEGPDGLFDHAQFVARDEVNEALAAVSSYFDDEEETDMTVPDAQPENGAPS